MGSKRKQTLLGQKVYFEKQLQDRMAFLSGKGGESRGPEKDPVLRRIQADIRAVNRRLRRLADQEKLAEQLAKMKAEKAAAPPKEKGGGKPEKSKKAPDEAKGKKAKAEKKAAPPKSE
ncbi:MAG: hypothetical protein FJY83_09370 [Candidatus Aminicenantes bacterium]|nr:hypothetical protein [Candidatus Aminicenantes bacterium]